MGPNAIILGGMATCTTVATVLEGLEIRRVLLGDWGRLRWCCV